MDIKSVPQDESSTYANNKKAIYAVDEEGKVKVATSSGWEAEETATKEALNDLQERAKEAYEKVLQGEFSPLYFHMYDVRMDLQVLSESTGFFKWTIKRDFKPERFQKISLSRLDVYAEAMGREVNELKVLPKGRYE